MSVDWDTIYFGEEDGEYMAEILFDHFGEENNTSAKMLFIIRNHLTSKVLKTIKEYLTNWDNALPMVIYHNHILRQQMLDEIREKLIEVADEDEHDRAHEEDDEEEAE